MNTSSQSGVPNALAALLFTGLLAPAVAEEAENLTYDPASGIYTIYYYNTYDQATPVLKRAQFELPTRIDPTVKAKVKESEQGRISYQYKIRNNVKGQQDLVQIRLVASQVYESNKMTPAGWHGGEPAPHPQLAGFLLIGWFYESDTGGIEPGKSQTGFSFESHDLPGVGIMETWGNERDLGGFPDLGPSSGTPIGRQYLELISKNESVARPAAVPKIPNPQPFDAAAVLTSLQKHVKEDIVNMKLIDPAFAARLDRGLQAAIDAAKRGNTAGLKEQLKELRHLLKGFGEPEEEDHRAKKEDDDTTPEDQVNTKPWPHPVSKLAARVIDFDLQYIERRMK